MGAVSLAPRVGVAPACRALGISRATFYRHRRCAPGRQQPPPTPARALAESERRHIFEVFISPRFVDYFEDMYQIPVGYQDALEDMCMVIHPCLTSNEVCFWSEGIKERRTAFTQEDYFFVEQIVVNPPLLLSCAVVRKQFVTFSPQFSWHAQSR